MWFDENDMNTKGQIFNDQGIAVGNELQINTTAPITGDEDWIRDSLWCYVFIRWRLFCDLNSTVLGGGYGATTDVFGQFFEANEKEALNF